MRVLVADDQPAILKRICLTLATCIEVEACQEASDGAEAVEAARDFNADLIILDTSMPG